MNNAAIIAADPATAADPVAHVNGTYSALDRVRNELALCLDGFAGGHARARFVLAHYRRLGGSFGVCAVADIVLA